MAILRNFKSGPEIIALFGKDFSVSVMLRKPAGFFKIPLWWLKNMGMKCKRTGMSPPPPPLSLPTIPLIRNFLVKGELHSNYIFLYFVFLFCIFLDSINLFTKTNYFFFQNSHFSTIYTRHIYMTFYLLTWTYFNDVNGGRNILINSQLKRILFRSSGQEKMTQNWEREKTRKKKITAMKVRLPWKWDTRFTFFEAFWTWTKNKHGRLMMKKNVLNIN